MTFIKHTTLLLLALGLAALARAEQPVTWIWAGMKTPVPGALARDGYVATHWAGADVAHLRLVGASAMMDAFNEEKGRNFEGRGWYDLSRHLPSKPGGTYYAVTRVFQYRPGKFLGTRAAKQGAFDAVVENLDLDDLAAFWADIQGTPVPRVEVGAAFVLDAQGMGTFVTANYPSDPQPLSGAPAKP